MSNSRVNFTTPAGRLVAGSLYAPKTTDAEGRPLVVKNGPDTGKPRVEYFFALAIAKGPEAAHGAFGWMMTDWGQKIRTVAESWMPHAGQLPAFAWKVKDGDSTVPNKKGKRPCDSEGWAGHWVLFFSTSFQSTIYTLVGQTTPQPLAGDNAVNLGDYVQVNGDVDNNGAQNQPGVYLNHRMVCLLGYGPRIVVGPDVASAGFGGVALPPGASAQPPAGFTPPVQGALPPTSAPAVPALPVPPATASTLPPPLPPAGNAALPPLPQSVAAPPNPAILLPPPAVAAPAGPVMSPAATQQGITWAILQQNGWTLEQAKQAGHVVG